MDNNKVILSWSSGKDSALALYEAQNSGLKIDYIFTTVCEDFNRVSIHGIKNELVQKQAEALKLELKKVNILSTDSMDIYKQKINQFWKKCSSVDKVKEVIFGDIFLEDLKKYREEQLKNFQVKARFPLWKRNTSELIESFIEQGFKAILICVDTNVMPKEFVGREIDRSFSKIYQVILIPVAKMVNSIALFMMDRSSKNQ